MKSSEERRDDGGARPRLAPCPETPNCVSSLEEREARRVKPIRIVGRADAAWAAARRVLAESPRAALVSEGPGRMRWAVTTPVFRFVDDLDLVLDAAAGLIHVRSASREGHWDLGANRRRVERLRRQLAARGVARR